MASTGSSVNRDSIVRLKQLRDKLGHFTNQVDRRAFEILIEESTRMTAEAKMMVPVDSHALQDSIKTVVTRDSPLKVSLKMSASATNKGFDYADIQHNVTWYKHKHGGPFYISIPFQHGVERITDRLHDEVKYDR